MSRPRVARLERRIAPSVLACDFGRIAEEVRAIEAAGAQLLHLDVMDGHFVPNISFGPDVVAAIRRVTALPLDVHLMITFPERYIEAFLRAGSSSITIHIEAAGDLGRQVARIRQAGAEVGLALRPDTPLDRALPWIPAIDLLLVMTVHPGFGGQALIPSALDKVRAARVAYPSLPIEVDGGINLATLPAAREAGANLFVAGSAVFGAADRRATLDHMAALLAAQPEITA